MTKLPSIETLARGGAVLAVAGLLVVLALLLPEPGYSTSRLVLFGLLAASAIAGAAGVLTRRHRLVAVGVVGLFLLGFWQAVLSVFVYPVIAVLVVAALAGRDDEASA